VLPSLTFVLGGAASGKSLVAENIIYNSDLQLVYVATSRIFDDEMQTKINTHIARRDARWTTISVEKDIPEVLVKLTVLLTSIVLLSVVKLANCGGEENKTSPGITSEGAFVDSPGLAQPTARLSPPPSSFIKASM